MWSEAFLAFLLFFSQMSGRHQKTRRQANAQPVRARAKRKHREPGRGGGEARYRLLVEFSPDAIVIHRGGKFVFVNPAAEQLFGATEAELIGTPVIDRVHPDYRQIVQERLQQLYEDGKQAPLIEEKFLRLDGRAIDVEVAAIALSYEGEPAVEVVIRDIGERKRAEKLQEAVYKIAQAVDQTRTLGELYHTIHTIISEVMPANNFYIALYDEKEDLITFPYFVNEVDAQRPSPPAKPGRGLTEYVLHSGQSLLCDLTTEAELQRHGEVELVGAPAPIWLGVPLKIEQKTIGVMAVQHYTDPKAYGERERQIFEFLSSQVARAIERKRTEEEIRRRVHEFAVLFETARDLAQQSDLPTLLQTIIERAVMLLAVPGGFIYLHDAARNDLEMTVTKGFTVPLGARLQMGEGMAGRVAQTRKPLIVEDYKTWPYRSLRFNGMPFSHVLEVPMLYGGELIGVLGVNEVGTTARRFGEADIGLLSHFAAQAASAVHNARLLQETSVRAKQLALINQISGVINQPLALKEVLDSTLHELLRVLNVDRGDVAIFEESREYLRVIAESDPTSGPSALGRTFPLKDNPSMQTVLREGRPLGIVEAQNEAFTGTAAPLLREIGTQSILIVPLLAQGRVIGTIGLDSKRRYRVFTAAEIELAQTVANQAAAAIEKARLYTSAQQELAERKRVEANLREKITALQTLAEIDREVIAAAEASAVMQLVCRRAAELLHVPKALIGAIIPPAGTPLVFSHGLADPVRAVEEFERLRLADVLEAQAGTSAGAVVIDEWHAPDPRLSEFGARENIRALAGQPLRGANRLGTLFVFDAQPREWDDEDLELLSLLAGQAAIALEKSRILTELQSSLTMTTRFYQLSGKILAANTFEETARLVTHTLREGFVADVASIHLYDPQGRPVIQYDEGLPGTGLLSAQPRPEGITLRALKSDVPIVFDNPELLHPLVRAAGIRSVIAVPLRSETDNFGVLFVDYRQLHKFTEREVELLSLFANQTALALKRVRLLDETRRRADHLAVLNRIAGAASRTLDLDELLQIIYHEVSAAVSAESFLIALYDITTDELDHRIHIDKDLRLPPERLPLGRTPLVAHIIHNRAGLLIKDLQQEGNSYPTPRLAGTMRPTRSWLGVPLQVGSSVVGVICVQAYHPNAYGEDEKQFLATVADQVAVAVKNAQLFEETRQRLSELEAINKISTAVRGAQTLEKMLPLLLDETLAALGTTAGQIAFHDPAMDELRVAVARGWFAQTPTAASSDDGIAGRVFTTGRAYISREFKLDSATSELARAQIPLGWGGAIFPIRAGQQIIGVFCLSLPLPREIQPNEVHLLTTIAEIAGNAVHRMRLHESLEASYLETVLALAKAMDARDSYTNGHADRLATLAVRMAQKVGISAEEQDALWFAARLHDIGKIGVPDSILLKPAALTSEEWAVMQRHPITGAEIIQPVRRLRAAAPIVRHHHERFDGTGYPDRLAGEGIPLGARILAVVDSYGAMIDDRVYRKGRPSAEALAELRLCAGTQFDPNLVEIFLRLET